MGLPSSLPPPAALPSESAGAYEFVTELARGALGPLFGARMAAGGDDDRVVAIRRIPIECCAREDVQAIVETARTARRVRHSKVATLLEAVVTEREILLVGEYVDGCSLSSLLRVAIAKRAPLPPPVVLRIGLELLRGLRAVRETWRAMAPSGARVAPRGGISPDNVFVATFGEVVLSEVGVSAVASALVPFRTFPGILAYLSPEQIRDNGEQPIDERAEVFNVGVILWELLANRPLFGGAERLHADPDDQSLALADRILEDVESKPIPALSSTECNSSPTVRAALEVVERALSRDPAARFASIDQMRLALLALNREALASSEQVRTAIQALAGTEIAAQRAAVGLPSSTRPAARPASARDSKRPSLRPQALADTGPTPANSLALRSLPRLPKPASRSIPPPPPTRSFRPSSIPPPPSTTPPPASVRSVPKTSTPPPPPVRKAKASSAPPPGNVENPPSASASDSENPIESVASAPFVAPKAAAAFVDPVPPPLELAEADPPASAFGDPVAAAPIRTDDGASSRPRARRLALVIGGVAGLIGLLGLLRVVLRQPASADVQSAPAIEAAPQTAASVRQVAEPHSETVNPRPGPLVPALTESSAALSDRKNPPFAPTKPLQHADNGPDPTAPPESYRRPEVRPEPVQKEFRPNGI
jgi:eukaryotic-like serine/threonine-protein kinase